MQVAGYRLQVAGALNSIHHYEMVKRSIFIIHHSPFTDHAMKIFISILLILHPFMLAAQDEWKLTRNEKGIKVYTASGENSKFKRIKVEASITGTIDKLMAVLLDVANNKQWVYHTRKSHLVQLVSPHEVVYYAETTLPWPLSNRDVAIRMSLVPDTINNALTVTAIGEPDAVPLNKGLVRIRYFQAKWEVKETNENEIAITYYLTVNPAGSISPGISNMFVTKGPFETFNNLAGLLRR